MHESGCRRASEKSGDVGAAGSCVGGGEHDSDASLKHPQKGPWRDYGFVQMNEHVPPGDSTRGAARPEVVCKSKVEHRR